VSDLSNPYKLTANNDGTYSFVTDEATEYVITMDNASYYVEDLPPIFKIYEFGFYPPQKKGTPQYKTSKSRKTFVFTAF
jgi:hypothetical protein